MFVCILVDMNILSFITLSILFLLGVIVISWLVKTILREFYKAKAKAMHDIFEALVRRDFESLPK